MKSHQEMVESKWVNIVYLVLLSLGICSSSHRELAVAKEEDTYKQLDHNNNNPVSFHGEKWSWDGSNGFDIGSAIGGTIGGAIGGVSGAATGSIGGGISGIPGFNIGGSGGASGAASGSIGGGRSGIPGFNIGGGANGRISIGNGGVNIDGGIVAPGFSGGISGGVAGPIACGTAVRPCQGTGGSSDCGGLQLPGWLDQPPYCTPKSCQQENAGACGGIGLSLDFGSTTYSDNASTNESNINVSKPKNNGHDDHLQEQVPDAVAPEAGYPDQHRV